MKRTLAYFILIFYVSGCQKNPDVPNAPQGSMTHMKISAVFPAWVHPSEALTIIGENFDSTYWHNQIRLDGIAVWPDSGANGVLYARVPFKATTSTISVVSYRYENYRPIPVDSTVGPVVGVYPIDTCKFNLIAYAGQPLMEGQALRISSFGDTSRWTLSTIGDTIAIKQHFTFGDEGICEEMLRFYQLPADTLPRSVSGYVSVVILEASNNYTERGVVAIQDWNLSDKLSGRISVSDNYGNWSDFVFWYSFK